MKDELGGKLMIKFPTLKPKRYGHLIEDNDENKKIKGGKLCQDYKNYLEATQLKPTKNLMRIALEKIIKFP